MGEMSQNRWWVVASALGLTVGAGAIYISAFGVLLKPIAEDLGIGRGVFSSALLLLTITQAAGCVLLGFLLDRYGLRRIMIPGVLLYAASVAVLSTLTLSVAYMYLLFAIAGVIAAVASPVPYGAAVVAWFDRARGIALGLAIGGVGLGAILAPPSCAALCCELWLAPSLFGARGSNSGGGFSARRTVSPQSTAHNGRLEERCDRCKRDGYSNVGRHSLEPVLDLYRRVRRWSDCGHGSHDTRCPAADRPRHCSRRRCRGNGDVRRRADVGSSRRWLVP